MKTVSPARLNVLSWIGSQDEKGGKTVEKQVKSGIELKAVYQGNLTASANGPPSDRILVFRKLDISAPWIILGTILKLKGGELYRWELFDWLVSSVLEFCFLFFWDRASLSSSWPWTHHTQALKTRALGVNQTSPRSVVVCWLHTWKYLCSFLHKSTTPT